MGNYLFGYVGKGYLESSDTYLKVGAGMAQGWSDKNPLKYLENVINGNYGDNPGVLRQFKMVLMIIGRITNDL
ncbi:hypothetical protein [Streptococcus cristatus]|uniref:Bacterial toxin 44 domain-containing protein n=1 Tax=Streptococcus cristatus TaxID=45634 RepID=A0A139MY12_STRCR|nr:hypothetical protein [Streptococcus cristatus]KXT68668.1 hypothetical protein SCRDD08_01873 [Streptococcus cristatus]